MTEQEIIKTIILKDILIQNLGIYYNKDITRRDKPICIYYFKMFGDGKNKVHDLIKDFDDSNYTYPFKKDEGNYILKAKFDKINFNQIEVERKEKYICNLTLQYFEIDESIKGFYCKSLEILDNQKK